MSNLEHLVERQIIEHESRLKHIDEMLDHASEQVNTKEISKKELKELEDIRCARQELAEDLDRLRLSSRQEWKSETIESAGPLAIWDVVAQRIENFIERIHKK